MQSFVIIGATGLLCYKTERISSKKDTKMRSAIIFTAILIAPLVLTAMDARADDEIYRWVDENGVVHFGDNPEGQANSELIEIKNNPSGITPVNPAPAATGSNPLEEPPLSAAQQQRADRAEKMKEAAAKKEAIAAGCEQRHQLVAQLEPSPRVIVQFEDGTVGRLDDNERLEMLNEAKTYIAEKCDK
jgi:hypothetical protein